MKQGDAIPKVSDRDAKATSNSKLGEDAKMKVFSRIHVVDDLK